MNTPACVLRGVAAAACLLLASCAAVPELPWAPVAKDASAGFYNQARLEYRLDAGKLGQPLDILRVDGRQLDYEQIASSPQADRSLGTLIIQKPHPAGREGYARVTFAIDSGDPLGASSSWNPFRREPLRIGTHDEVHEMWAMDLPAPEADEYFRLLSTQNFYTATPRPRVPAQLAVTLDGRSVQKPWEALPELNQLARRVRSEGRLVAYLRPDALAGETGTAIVSVQAYRNLLAKTSPAGSPIAAGVQSDPLFAPGGPPTNLAERPAGSTLR